MVHDFWPDWIPPTQRAYTSKESPPECKACGRSGFRSHTLRGKWCCGTCGLWLDSEGKAYVPKEVLDDSE